MGTDSSIDVRLQAGADPGPPELAPAGTFRPPRSTSWQARLADVLRIASRLAWTLRDDLSRPGRLSIRAASRAWPSGFKMISHLLYDLDQRGFPADFMNDYQMARTILVNGQYRDVVNNKMVFHTLLLRHRLPVPPLYGVLRQGWLYPVEGEGRSRPSATLLDALAVDEPRVLKPIWGCHGAGFMRLERTDTGYALNDAVVARGELESLLARLDHYVVTGFVHQGAFAAALYPHTTNTLRILTLVDPDTAEAFLACVVHRIGTSRSHPVDNFMAGRGGLSAAVDAATGRLGPGAMLGADGRLGWHTHHPETGRPIEGTTVPGWIKLIEAMLGAANRFAFAPCIAWDVVVTEPGFMIIEGNSTPGMNVLQVHGPLLADPRVRRFYRHHRVLTGRD